MDLQTPVTLRGGILHQSWLLKQRIEPLSKANG